MRNGKKVSLAEIEALAGDLEQLQHEFLRDHGWTYSSEHPDCCWRWSREIKGRIYSLSTADAIHMQTSSPCLYDELEPEEPINA